LGLLVAGQVARQVARQWPIGKSWPELPRPSVPGLRRRAFRPDRLLAHLPLEPGMRVLAIGPAESALVSALAHTVGKYGKVYVLEPSSERAHRLTGRLRHERAANVEVLVGPAGRLELPDATFDLALCVGVLAEVGQRERALWNLHRVLRPGGFLAVSEALG